MYRIIMVCVAIFSLLLILPIPTHATPTITKDFAFIDNRPTNDLFGYTGLILNLDVIATDTGGSSALTGTGSSHTALANNSTFPSTFANPSNMNVNAVFPIIGGAEFTRFFNITTSQFSNVAGTYTYTVTNTSGQNTTSTTHNLNKYEVIPLPINLTFSNKSTTPVFTFTDPNPIPNVLGVNRKYEVLIFDDTTTNTNIFDSGVLITTTFTVPSGILQPGKTYYFRAQSMDFDPADFDVSGLHSNLESRAIAYATFQTAVPEPTTMLLVGSGLLGLFGLRRKFRK